MSTATRTKARVNIDAAKCKTCPEVIIFIDENHVIYAPDKQVVTKDVDFFAASPCTLYFENNTIFDEKYSLKAGDNWLTPKGSGGVSYSIDEPLGANKPSDPRIVVP